MTEEELNRIEAVVRERATSGDIDPEPSLSLIALARVGLESKKERGYITRKAPLRVNHMFPPTIDFILILASICLALWLIGQGLSFI